MTYCPSIPTLMCFVSIFFLRTQKIRAIYMLNIDQRRKMYEVWVILWLVIFHSVSITYHINHLICSVSSFPLWWNTFCCSLPRGLGYLIFFRVHKIPARRFNENSWLTNFRASVMIPSVVFACGFSKQLCDPTSHKEHVGCALRSSRETHSQGAVGSAAQDWTLPGLSSLPQTHQQEMQPAGARVQPVGLSFITVVAFENHNFSIEMVIRQSIFLWPATTPSQPQTGSARVCAVFARNGVGPSVQPPPPSPPGASPRMTDRGPSPFGKPLRTLPGKRSHLHIWALSSQLCGFPRPQQTPRKYGQPGLPTPGTKSRTCLNSISLATQRDFDSNYTTGFLRRVNGITRVTHVT